MNALFFESNTVGCAHLVERDCATLDRILVDDLIDSSWKGELQNKWRVLAILSKPLPYSQRLQDVKIKLYQDVAVTRGFNYDERSKQADHDANSIHQCHALSPWTSASGRRARNASEFPVK